MESCPLCTLDEVSVERGGQGVEVVGPWGSWALDEFLDEVCRRCLERLADAEEKDERPHEEFPTNASTYVRSWWKSTEMSLSQVADKMSAHRNRRKAQLLTDDYQDLQGESHRVRKLDVLNTSFFIWVHGDFGTINGHRLGISPSRIVPISEVNLAFGEVAFLVDALMRRIFRCFDKASLTVAEKRSLSALRRARISVRGAQSSICIEDDPTRLPLYLTDSSITWYFHLSKFNMAMGSLMETCENIITIFKFKGGAVTPVVRVEQRLIGGRSLRLRSGEETQWNEALKSFLINLKWMIGTLSFIEGDMQS